jgi:LPXTG-site transpeptidase (sortase) family protein
MEASRLYLQKGYNTSNSMGKTSKGTKNASFKTIGNILMVLSIVGLFLVFFPLILDEIYYRTAKTFVDQPISPDFNLRIKSLKLNIPVIENVNPWNRNEYLLALQKGIAHATGSATPNLDGTVYLFSHSSDVPWRITRYNTAFYRLRNIKVGDEILITYRSEDYSYLVSEKKVVWPSEVEYLLNQEKNQLILQTCTPIGTDFKRLLVFAEKI